MSSIDRDPKRKVSHPTESDFIRGVANSANYPRGMTSLAAGFLVTFLVGKYGSRGGRK
jgi:hypothetical protein